MENHQEYSLHLVAKGTDTTESIKNYIEKKLSKLEKLTPHIIDIHVKIEVQKLDHSVNFVMKFSHFSVNSHAVTHDLYQSIDRAIEKLQKKLRKWKTKIQHHHTKKPPIQEIPLDIFENTEAYLDSLNDMIEDESANALDELFALPKVIKSAKHPLKTLTMDEALMKLELSADSFLLFRGEEDQKLKVIYRREDRSYGLIQPE